MTSKDQDDEDYVAELAVKLAEKNPGVTIDSQFNFKKHVALK